MPSRAMTSVNVWKVCTGLPTGMVRSFNAAPVAAMSFILNITVRIPARPGTVAVLSVVSVAPAWIPGHLLDNSLDGESTPSCPRGPPLTVPS